jgi:hypothetical protein
MGFVKQLGAKLTGADVQADAMERGANEQAAATRAAAEQAAAAAQDAAKQTAAQSARLQANSAAQSAALAAAGDTVSQPPETPEVQVADVAPSGAAKKRREKFGIGSAGSGVNI